MASNTIFTALGKLDNYLEKTMKIKSALPPGSYKTSLDTPPLQKSLSLHCKPILRRGDIPPQFLSVTASK